MQAGSKVRPGIRSARIVNAATAEAGELVFTVTLSPASSRQVTVNYATSNGSATPATATVARRGRNPIK